MSNSIYFWIFFSFFRFATLRKTFSIWTRIIQPKCRKEKRCHSFSLVVQKKQIIFALSDIFLFFFSTFVFFFFIFRNLDMSQLQSPARRTKFASPRCWVPISNKHVRCFSLQKWREDWLIWWNLFCLCINPLSPEEKKKR